MIQSPKTTWTGIVKAILMATTLFLGMAGVQRIGPLKQFFMDEARGVSGKLPELLKA